MAQLKGSFRGVPFGLYAHTMDSGRRVVVHEFPQRDRPFSEDMGRKARAFSLEMFVNGDDVAAQRDSLRKALEQKGPGVLVHPSLGTLTVQVGSFSISETFDGQRLARFNVGFFESGKAELPSVATNLSGTVSAASTAAALAAGRISQGIDAGKPAPAAAMAALAASASSAIQTAARRAALPNSLPTLSDRQTAIQAMSAYVADAQGIAALVATPDLMSFACSDLVFRLSGLGLTRLQAFFAYQRLMGEVSGLFSGLHYPSSAAGLTMAANAALFQASLLTAVVGSAASAAVDADFSTFDQAVMVREALSGMFDIAFDAVTDDNLFGYLQDLRAASLPAIPNPDRALPNVVKVRTATALPSLVLAWDLMTGSGDEQTLLDLNGDGNPWFVPGKFGTSVLVLR